MEKTLTFHVPKFNYVYPGKEKKKGKERKEKKKKKKRTGEEISENLVQMFVCSLFVFCFSLQMPLHGILNLLRLFR